jgi:DNA-binding MarR family transcriptional regulator
MGKFGHDEKRRLLRTSGEFIREFTPPDYLIDGILLRGFLYALTARTGDGKTAIALAISLHAAIARALDEHGVDRIKVLYLAGENDIDVRMRWIKTCEENKLDPDDVGVVFMPGVEKLSDEKFQAKLRTEADELGPFGLVFVDTSAAYSEAEDENANVQMQEHARVLRALTKLPGCPTVIVLCHPVKTPNMDSLVPKGGGNFLNAIDGNLCCKMDKRNFVVELHTAGKFRGPEFAPLYFALKIGTSEKIKDSKGRMIKTVTARVITEEEREKLGDSVRDDQTNLLVLINENDQMSIRKAAELLGWSKSKVHRMVTNLTEGRYITKDDSDDQLTVTDKGLKLIKDRIKASATM